MMPLFDEPLWVAMSARHPLASRAAIEPSDIALCAEPALGVRISGDCRAASLETIMHLVESGFGVTLVPELYVRQAHPPSAGIALRRYASKGASRHIRLAYRNGTARRDALTNLAKVTRGVWNRLTARQ